MVSCEECWKLLRGECELYYEVEDAYRQYNDVKKGSLRLDETKEDYLKEKRELRRIWKYKRFKRYKCFKRRKYCQLELGYECFRLD